MKFFQHCRHSEHKESDDQTVRSLAGTKHLLLASCSCQRTKSQVVRQSLKGAATTV